MHHYIFVAAAVMASSLTGHCSATDLSFDDIVAFSPNNEWKITATSPDNATSLRRPWQGDFVYSAFRNGGTKPHWTRKQSSQNPDEESPIQLVVADNGWVAIHTGRDQLVFIDPAGRNRGRIDDIKTYIPEGELATHGVVSSAGLIWSPYSLWYFMPVRDEQFFVVRPWWGSHIVIRPESGELAREAGSLQRLMNRAERERAISLLASYTSDPVPETDASSIFLGAYLAGVLRIEEVIPWLHQLERSSYVGSESFRLGEDRTSAVDPFSFRCYTARQVSRLSLRRLGAAVGSTPIYEFPLSGLELEYFQSDSQTAFNESSFSLVQVGMTAENVLERIGSPDFVVGECWEYDAAGDSPMTFVIEWDDERVAKTEKVAPKWTEGLERDQHIALF